MLWADVPPSMRATRPDIEARAPNWLKPDEKAKWIAKRLALMRHPRCGEAIRFRVGHDTRYAPCAQKVRRSEQRCAAHGGAPIHPLSTIGDGGLRYKLQRVEHRSQQLDARIQQLLDEQRKLDARRDALKAAMLAGQRGLQRRDAPLPGVPANRPLGGG